MVVELVNVFGLMFSILKMHFSESITKQRIHDGFNRQTKTHFKTDEQTISN